MNNTMRSEGSPTVADSQRFGRSAHGAVELLYRGILGRSVDALLALVALSKMISLYLCPGKITRYIGTRAEPPPANGAAASH